MSTSKRKWDEPSEGAPKAEESGKTAASAADAAAAAAAIAAKIAAQFASGAIGGEGEFSTDIDINDVRNRYMLTRGTTQQEINEATGASVSTKGVWYPDRSKATEKDPPLYLHVSAKTEEALRRAIDKINEFIALELGSLVEDKKDRSKRKWPEEKLPVALESLRNFNVRAKVVGPSGTFVKYIQQETGARVQIKGIGSGFIDQETGKEGDEPLYIHITAPEDGQVARAKVLTEDLLLVVRSEHAKMATLAQQQQMELHQAQAQYAAYASAMSGYPPPPPSDPTPDQPPPPAPDGSAPTQAQAADPAAYAQYWAAYGYDVNSEQFKEWAASQQSQYQQYYATQGQQPAPPAGSAPAPPSGAPPGDAPPAPPPAPA